jgi:hypothetical protein
VAAVAAAGIVAVAAAAAVAVVGAIAGKALFDFSHLIVAGKGSFDHNGTFARDSVESPCRKFMNIAAQPQRCR